MSIQVKLDFEDYKFICGLVHQHSAIALEEEKKYLAESRLQDLAKREGIDSLRTLVRRLRHDPAHNLLNKVVEAMTTNETSFFRDFHPFEAMRKKLLPELIERRGSQRRLRIWSAACSSGQEPYSMAMLLREHFAELLSWNLRLLASDLSSEMLELAKLGQYSHLDVNRGVPLPLLLRYFQRNGLDWTIDDSIRRMVDFQVINLVSSWPILGKMDLILLRNVLIYFNVESKKRVLDRMSEVLAPDGYLVLGGSETTLFVNDLYDRIEVPGFAMYRLKKRGLP
jgi:chemotaxis protein methyltransferase CheR